MSVGLDIWGCVGVWVLDVDAVELASRIHLLNSNLNPQHYCSSVPVYDPVFGDLCSSSSHI